MSAACTADPRVSRMMQIADWLRSLGACGLCALDMAFAQVEKEHGERFELRRSCVKRADRTRCEARAKANWKSMPTAAT